jgi:hypothetical protein
MKYMKLSLVLYVALAITTCANSQVKPDTLRFKPFVWKSETPADCPFEQIIPDPPGSHYGMVFQKVEFFVGN